LNDKIGRLYTSYRNYIEREIKNRDLLCLFSVLNPKLQLNTSDLKISKIGLLKLRKQYRINIQPVICRPKFWHVLFKFSWLTLFGCSDSLLPYLSDKLSNSYSVLLEVNTKFFQIFLFSVLGT